MYNHAWLANASDNFNGKSSQERCAQERRKWLAIKAGSFWFNPLVSSKSAEKKQHDYPV